MPNRSFVVVVPLVALVTACGGDDCGDLELDRVHRICVCPTGTALVDGGTCQRVDAGADAAPSCEPTPEVCNGLDDDCDGAEDDMASCGTVAHASRTACEMGACVAACHPGYDDCNGDFDDGCEAELASDEAHCGACFAACGSAEACLDGACATIPVYDWVSTGGSARADYAHRVAVDAAGNVYTIGGVGASPFTFGGITRDDGTTSPRRFLMSHAPDGSVRFVLRFGAYDVAALAVTPLGDLVVVGSISGTSYIEDRSLTAQGSRDGFAAVVTSGGEIRLLRAFGGTGDDMINDVALDDSGRLLVIGDAERAFTSDGLTIAAGSYVAELGSSLEVLRSGSLPRRASVAAIRGSTLGIAGQFSGTLTIGTSVLTATSTDVFGAWCDVTTFACTNGVHIAGVSYNYPRDVALDDDDRLVIATQRRTASRSSALVGAFERSGATAWEVDLGAPGRATAVAFDGANVVALVDFGLTGTLGDRPVSSSGASDLLAFAVAHDGSIAWWSQSTGGGNELAGGLALGAGGRLTISGSFSDGAMIGGTRLAESDIATELEPSDAFVALARYR